jgi:hypothetical protein
MFESVHKCTEYIWNTWNAYVCYCIKKNLLGCNLGDFATGNIIMLFYLLEMVAKALLQSLLIPHSWYSSLKVWISVYFCIVEEAKHTLFCQWFQSVQNNEICPGWHVNKIITSALRIMWLYSTALLTLWFCSVRTQPRIKIVLWRHSLFSSLLWYHMFGSFFPFMLKVCVFSDMLT